MSALPEAALADRFSTASELLASSVGKATLRLQGYQANAALTEALFMGLMRRLDHGVPIEQHNVRTAAAAIREDPEVDAAVSRATADEERVKACLEKATAAFAKA